MRLFEKLSLRPFAVGLLLAGLFLLCSTAYSQGSPPDFRNTSEYKDAWNLYQRLEGAAADQDKFDKGYADSLGPSRLDIAGERLESLAKLPGAFYDAFVSSFKMFVGLDPNKPVSEQFFEKVTVYVPVKGYAELNQDQRLVDHYHKFLFISRVQRAAAGLEPAHERALLAIRECDDSLLAQSLREIDFVISEFEAVDARADEQIEMNAHQIHYYDQEMAWLDFPELEVRGDRSINVVEYLKLSVSMRELRRKGAEWRKLDDDVEARQAFIRRWTERISEVQAYVKKSLPLIKENQQKIRQAYDKRACTRCTK